MYQNFFKRLFDIIIGLIALPFVLIIIAVVAPFIYFTDKGPIFYNGKRIGRDGHLFAMYKFRSMYVNAPDIRLKDGSTYNGDDDPRVTKIGRFLRNTSLDEVPQFLNVLIGDMSFVGNRPDTPYMLSKYTEEQRIILKCKPGITGYNQAYYRNSVEIGTKIRNDVYYVQHVSFWFDVKIILKTIKTVLFRENITVDQNRM
mgnify:FL=1